MIGLIDGSTEGDHTDFHSLNLKLFVAGLEDVFDPNRHQVLSPLTTFLTRRRRVLGSSMIVVVESTTTLSCV